MSPEYSILFLRQEALWKISSRGIEEVAASTPSERLFGIRYTANRWLNLTASPGGRFVAVDGGAKEETMLFDTARGSSRRFIGAQYPAFSPGGCHLAATFQNRNTNQEEIRVLDLQTNQWRTLYPGASEPVWSADGREIAAVQTSPQDNHRAIVFDAKTGKCRFRSRPTTLPVIQPILSPDSRFLGAIYSLSRPKRGHTLFDRRTGQVFERDLDYPNRLPTVIEDWSLDGRFLICNWRVPDPDNDGSWLCDEIGIVSLALGIKRWVARGHAPCFTPQGWHIVYLRPYREEVKELKGDLCICSKNGGTPRVLAKAVDAFVIARPPIYTQLDRV
jgi:hypothetical protein